MITKQEIENIINKHNEYRENNIYNCPPLQESIIINEYSQQRANDIAKSGKFKHAENMPYGENLWCTTNVNIPDISTCVDSWMAESYSWLPDQNNWQDGLGHFSQCVWRNTTHIGCGKSIMEDEYGVKWLVVVCNYNPPGNIIGQFPY